MGSALASDPVDPSRLDQSFDVIGLLEETGLRYAVALNRFDGANVHPRYEVREALDPEPRTPLVSCDTRDTTTATSALIARVEYLLSTQENCER